MAGVPTNVAQLMAVLSLNPKPFQTEAAGVIGMMGKAGPIGIAALGLGAVVAGVGVVATKMAGDFQAGMTSLATGAGEATAMIRPGGQVYEGILQMAKDTGTSTKQLVDGMYMIESGGFHGAAGLKILLAAAEGAKVGSADLGTIADTTDTILKNFGEHGALTATQAVNALITTVANGKTHLEDLGSSLSGVLPAGAAAGLGLKDVLGAMAELTNVGIPAAEASTYLRQMIIALEAPSAGAKAALDKIGISSAQLAAKMKKGLPDALQFIEKQLESHGIKPGTAQYVASLREISGGTRQMQGMLNLMGPHLADFTDKVKKIGGAASTTGNQVTGWALVQKNMNQQFDRAKEVAETLFIQLGQNLLPVMTNFFSFMANNGLPAIKNLVQWLTGTGNQLSWLRPILAVVAIAIGGALVAAFVAWAISAAAAAVATIAATWPILAIGAAIALLIAGIILLVTHWKVVQAVFQASMAVMGRLLGWLGDRFGELFGHIGEFVGGVIGWFGNLQKNVEQKAHDIAFGVIDWFKHLQKGVEQKAHDLAENAVKKFMELQSNLMQWGHDTAKKVIDTLTGLPGKFLQLGKDIMAALANGIKNAAGTVGNALKNIPGVGGMLGGLGNIIPKFAAQGGVFGDGEWGVVGERGPESIRVQGGRATITPLAGTGMLATSPAGYGMGGGGGYANGQPIVVQLVADGRKLAEVTVRHMPGVIRAATGQRRF